MLCGPLAAARASGVDVQTIIARIRYRREQRGERQSLRGGTMSSELRYALDCEGWRMRRVFQHRRVSLPKLAARIQSGRWIFHQSNHFFGVRSGKELRDHARRQPNARPITTGYLVHRKRS